MEVDPKDESSAMIHHPSLQFIAVVRRPTFKLNLSGDDEDLPSLKAAVGRKITGADLQALQAVMAAMRKSQGESFEDLVTAEIPLAVLIGKGHTNADLQRTAKDWDSTIESVTETLGKRRVAFTKLFRFLCEILQANVNDVPAVPM